MVDILKKITDKRKLRVEELKKTTAKADFIAQIDKNNRSARRFTNALKSGKMSVIAEVKKASPSKGIFRDSFPYLEIAKSYENGGAAAISVLTEPDFFLGENRYLEEISANTSIPILRKDFIIDEIQLYEAKAIGADAVLLIAGVLDGVTLGKFMKICGELKLDYIVEVHNEEVLQIALPHNPAVIGINNRNLRDFSVSLETTARLAAKIPPETVIISESGIFTNADVKRVHSFGARAVLVGESLIKSGNIGEKIKELVGDEN